MKSTFKNTQILLVVVLLLLPYLMVSQIIKVACVGDSVTYGMGIENGEENSFPAQLQNVLGTDYEVGNFGYSGATMLKKGHKPYWEKDVFKASQEFAPNIVVIHLGLNDQGTNNWPAHHGEFEQDYLDMIAIYKNLPSRPEVILCKMTPTFSGHHWFEEGMRESFKEIQLKIEAIAQKAEVALIDLHEPLYRFPEYFPDNLHPTKEGATIIADKVYGAITGNYGGLKLPILYGDNMVLQRDVPIVFNGTANANETINVEFNKDTKRVKANFRGEWTVSFPPMSAGGPYALKFTTRDTTISINKVYLGEVWLASGQSNMRWKVRDMEGAATVLKDSINPQVFLFDMKGKTLSGKPYTQEELQNCNADTYFENTGWASTTSENVKDFSAVAYTFAYHLQKKLNVPVGIIHNAIGGSPTQSWISRAAMEQTHETINLLNDTHLNPMVDSWVNKTMVTNLENRGKFRLRARHPYEPTILFDAGILPISDYNIKGVIWYQGESNAEQVELHKRLFEMLVKDWRHHFKNPEMPFHYVQLSSIDRPNWGWFRDSQRKMLEIPHTGMAVSYDVGNKTDVHPREKWVVGKRLANSALHETYDKQVPFSGPLLDYVNVKEHTLEVHFKYGEGLTTSDNGLVKDVLIANADKVFVPATAKIVNDTLVVWSSEVKHPRYVKYGYTSFSEGNLINGHGLPAPTFSNNN